MARKKKEKVTKVKPIANGVISGAGEVVDEKIVSTVKENFMPYAMSVITSRAIPEIDGFKPSHRKLLFTMYKMGLLSGNRTKSANIVGATMKFNPHGDSAIYETMVRLSRGNEALLHPYVDSKGNFGKFYSRDMAYAASRYTEARLDPICNELFKDIDKDTVDFVDNYDNTMKEPVLLPASYPSVLVNSNTGIAVGMASNICSFNLRELCETTAALIRDKSHDVLSTLPAPDFSGGAQIIYDEDKIREVYETGRGGIKVRSIYTYDKKENCIDITNIPPTATIEGIIEKVVDLVKTGFIKEISDIRDETGIDGLKITIDLKRGTDPDKLMLKLFKKTDLEANFPCNFNVLIGGVPQVLGVKDLLEEWIAFRIECVRRRTYYDLHKKKDKLHLLKGLELILLDIDKAIKIVRKTEEESEVVPNLMVGFGIDKIQAEFVAELKLRHLNKEYILKRTADIKQLVEDIKELEAILNSKARVKTIIVNELKEVAEKYGKDRLCPLLYIDDEVEDIDLSEEIPDYPVNLFFTHDGYFKKITPLSLRMGGNQKLKDGDFIISSVESNNNSELLFFTNKCQVYKARVSDFQDTKASAQGDFVAGALGMEEGETAVFMVNTIDYAGYLLFAFENGKVAKVDLESYKTVSNRKKLIKAYSDKSPLAGIGFTLKDSEFVITSSSGRMLLLHSGALQVKSTKSTQGVSVMKLKKGHRVMSIVPYEQGTFSKPSRYRTKNLPAAGAMPSEEDSAEQLSII